MLVDEANMQKQKKREEQIKRWKEREMSDNDPKLIDSFTNKIINTKQTKVKFPKGCIFLAACSSGDKDEVKQHLKLGVNINTTNIDGLTALHQACIDANQDMVEFLVENNADINAQDNEGWTPLHAAVSVNNLDVAKYLIEKGARLDICNNDSDLPVDLCDSTNLTLKEYLQEEMKRQSIDAELEKQKEELLMYEDALAMRFSDKIHQKTGATALHVSAAKGYIRVIKLLIQSGANVNAVDKDGWTPLHAAAHWEQEEVCQILAENGASFDAKTYSGQTPFDVCDKEMASKLKALQSSPKLNQNNQKLTDVTTLNNKLINAQPSEPISARLRRPSDEFNKSTITRLPNEAKLSISDREKKQDKILLSPITSSISSKPHFDLYSNGNSDSDNEKPKEKENDNKQANNKNDDKENLNQQQQQMQVSQQQEKPQILTKTNSLLNKPKTGLQESLKTLSAQVRMKMDEDELAEKQISFKNSIDMNTESINNSNNNSGSECSKNISPTNSSIINNNNTPSIANSSSSTSLNNNNNNPRPYLERRWGNSSQNEPSTYKRRIGIVANSSNGQTNQENSTTNTITTNSTENPATTADLTSPSNRRYSSAPIASKDEQAELIRKQKAKLERHFRRSTQAVSYEDIKSAEASIKGTQPNSPNLNENIIKNEPTTPITPSSTTSVSSFNFNQTQTPNILTTVPISQTPITQQGVSNLSSIFGESIKSNISSSNLYALSKDSKEDNTNHKSSDQATEKDLIIANDIETDKLLNAIEKSKGFSDTYSTTAARRLRNRGIFFNPSTTNDRFDSANSSESQQPSTNTSNLKKINKLIWNEEKCEVEYKDKEDDSIKVNGNGLTAAQTATSRISPSNSFNRNYLETTNNQLTIDVNNSSNQSACTNNGSTTNGTNMSQTRPMYRFGQNDNNLNSIPSNSFLNSSTVINSLNNRPGIKRSVSQVPYTDRRPLNQNSNQTSINNNSTNPTSPTNTNTSLNINNNNNNNNNNTENEPVIKDFQAAYELMKKENEILNQTIKKLQKELEEQNKKVQSLDNGTLDKREKRAFDRRISELEEELKKVDNLKQDNNRLKEENAALIRVISKLSK